MYSGPMRGDDEPHIVSWRVLEGVIKSFDSFRPSEIPLWKQMKNSADQKAVNMMLQHAMEERSDILSKLLKMMGFQQRAELLLYEAMSYKYINIL